MTASEITGLALTLLLMTCGMVGAVLPVLPGPLLVFGAALVHRLWFGDHSVRWWVVGLIGGITLIITLLDFLASTYGAKRFGATRRGMVGAMIGTVAAMFWLPPLGLLLGPWIGAALAELLGGRPWREASKAGFGAAFGVLAGTLGKLAACVAMITVWLVAFFWQARS